MTNSYYLAAKDMQRSTQVLMDILQKAQEFVDSKKVEEKDLLKHSLAPDMFAFSRQIQIVSDTFKGYCSRMTDTENPSMPDNEETISQLIQRLQKTVDFANQFDENSYEQAAEKTVVLPFMKEMAPGMHLNANEYMREYAIPNFYFHVTIAYAILRNLGMPLGKGDFIGRMTLQKDL